MDQSHKTVLLMGGRSFLGGHLCRVLIERGYQVLLHSSSTSRFENLKDVLPHPQVTTVTCPLDSPEQLSQLFTQAQYLIYAAVPTHKQTLGMQKVRDRDFANFKNIFDLIKASPLQKITFISTCSTIKRVEGIADETCVTERQGWANLAVKFKVEQAVLNYARQGMPVTLVNPTMFIGEYDTRPSSGDFFKFFQNAPFLVMKGFKTNIIDIRDVALGAVLALEKGRVGERYILSGENIYVEDLIIRIKKNAGKSIPPLVIPWPMVLGASLLSEVINMVLKQPKPLAPLLGLELKRHGSQHYSCEKAKRELGFAPRDPWTAVDKACAWYKAHGML